jgi:hypothetical protein
MRRLGLLASALLALAVPSSGAADTVGFGLPPVPLFKTPPMTDSQTISVPLAVHMSPTKTNWAGFFFKLHLVDPSELDVTGMAPNTGLSGSVPPYPFGPPSSGVASSPLFFTFWHVAAQQSGITIPSSVVFPVGTLFLHAKNTTPINNSDTDLTAMVWNIFHLRCPELGCTGSSYLTIPQSGYVYANRTLLHGTHSTIVPQTTNPLLAGQVPTSPAHVGQGKWIHNNGPAAQLHIPPGQGSFFYALPAGTAALGIEHVPEPATAVLLGGGFLALGASGWLRRRRLRLG